MAFEKYFGQSKRSTKSDELSITSSGLINIGIDLAEQASIADGSYVVLLWDKSRSNMAIAPVREFEQGAYQVTLHKGGVVPHINGKSFLTHIGMDLTKLKGASMAVKATWNDEEGQIESEPMKGF